jgi:hypothetical protein
VELALRLLPVVDAPTRVAVASKLAAYPPAPPSVIERLARDVAEVAKIVRERPEQDSSAGRDMTEPRGRLEGPAAWIKPGRPGASAGLGNDLPGFRPRAGAPRDVPLGELFLQAEGAERRRLLERLDGSALAGLEAIPPAGGTGAAERLERAALERNQREFARELQHTLGLSRQTALRIVRDSSGEPTLVVARAVAISPEALVRILLFLNPAVGESVERVFTLSRFYDRVAPCAASEIVGSWREEVRQRAVSRYAGVHAAEAREPAVGMMENVRRALSARTTETPRQGETARSPARQRTT